MRSSIAFYNTTWFSTIVALLVGATLIYVTTQLVPKRRLKYGLVLVTSLITNASQKHEVDLELQYKNVPLTSPYIARVKLSLRGRQDLASDDYNDASQ